MYCFSGIHEYGFRFPIRARFVNDRIKELEKKIQRPFPKDLIDSYKEELQLYQDGCNYAGHWTGWPIVVLYTPWTSVKDPSDFVIVCRSEKRNSDIFIHLRTKRRLSSFVAIIEITHNVTDAIDRMNASQWAGFAKRSHPVFDSGGNFVDEDLLRPFDSGTFLQQK
jgi:hypothetical protein